jgi:hypothetical protein
MVEDLLERLVGALGAAGIPYMVMGGQAVLVHGEPRLTRDVDVTLGVGVDRLDDVVRTVAAAKLRPLRDPATFTRETLVLPCADDASGLRVDVLLSFSPFEQEAIARARAHRIGRVDVRFTTPEDLVVQKLVAGRARDLEDVRGVLRRNPTLDAAYVERWLAEWETLVERPLVSEFRAIRRQP